MKKLFLLAALLLIFIVSANGYTIEHKVYNMRQISLSVLYGDIAAIGHGSLCVPNNNDRSNNNVGVCKTPQLDTRLENMNLKYAYWTGPRQRDVEAHPTTSRTGARLTIPSGAKVSKAYMYWIGRLSANYGAYNGGSINCNAISSLNNANVRTAIAGISSFTLETPFSLAGATYEADSIYLDYYDSNCHYLARKDITSLFAGKTAAQANGSYLVSNIKTRRSGSPFGTYGGWTMIVIYDNSADPAQEPRLVTFWDMLDGSGSRFDTTVSGFLTPSSGAVDSTLIVMAADGDIDGDDRLCIRPTTETGNCPNPGRGSGANGLGHPARLPYGQGGVSPNGDAVATRLIYPYSYGMNDFSFNRHSVLGTADKDGPKNAFISSVTVGQVGKGRIPNGQLPRYNGTDGSANQEDYNLGFDLHTYYLNGHMANKQNRLKLTVNPSGDHVAFGVLGFSTEIFAPDFRQNFTKEGEVLQYRSETTCGDAGGAVSQSIEGATIRYTIGFENNGKEPAEKAVVFDDFAENGIIDFFDMNSVTAIGMVRTRTSPFSTGTPVAPICDRNATAVRCSLPAGKINVGDRYEMTFTINVKDNIPPLYADHNLTNIAKIRYYNTSLGNLAVEEEAQSTVSWGGVVCGTDSCKYRQAKGARSDGHYLIKPGKTVQPFEVFCEDMHEPVDPLDPAKGAKQYLPLPYQSSFSNIRIGGGELDEKTSYHRAAANERLGVVERIKRVRISDFPVPNTNSYKAEDLSAIGFSSLSLVGTPFAIDSGRTVWGAKCKYDPLTKTGLISGMFNQAVRIDSSKTAAQFSTICKPQSIYLKQLATYIYVNDGKEAARGGKIEAEGHSGAKSGSDFYTYESCRQIYAEPSARDQICGTDAACKRGASANLRSGHYFVSPKEKQIERPFVAYCTPVAMASASSGAMTAFIALDANETFSVEDLAPKTSDSCSRLGLLPFVPVTPEIMAGVRNYLLATKNEWRTYTGTIDQTTAIFYPQRVGGYYLPDGARLLWPYGPMGIYADVSFTNKAGWGQNPSQNLCNSHSKCDLPLYSKEHEKGSNPSWSLGSAGFKSAFERLNITRGSIDPDYNGTDKDALLSEWYISEFSCGPAYNGKPSNTKIPWDTNNYIPAKDFSAKSVSGYYVTPSAVTYAEPNGNYAAGEWLDYIADDNGVIYHCDDSWRNQLSALGSYDQTGASAGYSHIHYTCLSKDSYLALVPHGKSSIDGLNAWSDNPVENGKAPADGKLYTQVAGDEFNVTIAEIGTKADEPLNARVCARLVQLDLSSGAYVPIAGALWTAVDFTGQAAQSFKMLGSPIAVRDARIEFRYAMEEKTGVSPAGSADYDAAGFTCENDAADWSVFTDSTDRTRLSADNFAIRPGVFSLQSNGAAAAAGTMLKAIAGHDYNHDRLDSLKLAIATSNALGYNAAGAIYGVEGIAPLGVKADIQFTNEWGQPARWATATPAGVFGVNMINGVGDANFTFGDVGEFKIRFIDDNWTAVDAPDECILTDATGSGLQYYWNAAPSDGGHSDIAGNPADPADPINAPKYQVGCIISGDDTNASGRTGLLSTVIKVIPHHFQVDSIGFITPFSFTVGGVTDMFAYYGQRDVNVTSQVEAVNEYGFVTRNYTEGNYSKAVDVRYDFNASQERIGSAAAGFGVSPGVIPANEWYEGSVSSTNNEMVYFREFNITELPLSLHSDTGDDFNVSLIEQDGGDVNGSGSWSGGDDEITFIYGRANIHDVSTDNVNGDANITFTIDYYHPNGVDYGRLFSGTAPVSAAKASSGWRLVEHDRSTTANLIVIGNAAFASASKTAAPILNGKSADIAGVYGPYPDPDKPRPRRFIVHLSAPEYLWHMPYGKPYVSIDTNTTVQTDVQNSRYCAQHQCAYVEFKLPSGSNFGGSGMDEERYFKDEANTTRSPSRINW